MNYRRDIPFLVLHFSQLVLLTQPIIEEMILMIIRNIKNLFREGRITKEAHKILKINTLMMEGTLKSVVKAEKIKRTLDKNTNIDIVLRRSEHLRRERV